ncbi:MAG: hypothetical protein NZ524_00220 [Thiobacillaceae bacterium]|nr:hypothetical protein [Thiobacillaceae bacterium]MDW8324373.1 hypothetical protein [Burkholderiales bacterium]
MANAVKAVARYVRKNGDEESARILRELCEALESGQPFVLTRLYDTTPKAFELAMGLLTDWRFDRHLTERRFAKYFCQQDED